LALEVHCVLCLPRNSMMNSNSQTGPRSYHYDAESGGNGIAKL